VKDKNNTLFQKRGCRTQHILMVALLLLSGAVPARADVILHAFNWKYSEVTAKAEELASLGYKKVLVAPALKAEGSAWWSLYQPQDLRLIRHALGDKTDYEEMIRTLRRVGIDVYADAVLNHMANEYTTRSDLNFPGERVLEQYLDNSRSYTRNLLFGDLTQNLFSAADFHNMGCIDDYENKFAVENGRICSSFPGDPGLPDLADNPWVIEQQQRYLQALKRLGVKGFRIDAAKHMNAATLNRIFTPELRSGMHVFGEIITYGGKGTSEYDIFLASFLRETSFAAYDFPLLDTLKKAFMHQGSFTALADPVRHQNAVEHSRAITAVVTHDIVNNEGFKWYIHDPHDEMLAHAYILGRNGGTPLIYSDHNESGAGRWVHYYRRSDLKAMIRFHNSTQGAPMKVIDISDCHILFSRGDKGLVGINKCGSTVSRSYSLTQLGLKSGGTYENVLNSQEKVYTDKQEIHLVLDGRSAKMWLDKRP
jgi:alpha-amylase